MDSPQQSKKSELHIAYKRVSTSDQNFDRQLTDCSVRFSFVYEEKVSGKNTDRPELQRLLCDENLGRLHSVTLHVHSLDRLARNLADLLHIVNTIISKGWSIKFHKENLLFSNSGKNLFENLMLQMLGSFAEFERNMLLERQREGIAIAKAKGLYKGRKPSLDAAQINRLRKSAQAQGSNITALAREYGISRASVYNYLKG